MTQFNVIDILRLKLLFHASHAHLNIINSTLDAAQSQKSLALESNIKLCTKRKLLNGR